jgi:hypothetical protein
MRRTLPRLALGLFVVYAGWNLWWLASGQWPDSLFHAATGWPCPSTGATRAFAAYLRGQWGEAFLLNPAAPVLLFLLLVSGGILLVRAVRGQRLRLPGYLGIAWGVVLVLAWAAKFALGSQYW